MRDAEVEERPGISLNVYRALIKCLGTFNIALFQLLRALL